MAASHKMHVSYDGTRPMVMCECGWFDEVRPPFGDKMTKDGTPKAATARDKAKELHAAHKAGLRKTAKGNARAALAARVRDSNGYARQVMPQIRKAVTEGELQLAADMANELSALYASMMEEIENWKGE